MAQYKSTHTGVQIDDAISLVLNSTDTSGSNVPSSSNKITTVAKVTEMIGNITAADVGLGNVTNESKATMFTSPAFTGVPTAPTAAAGTNTTQIATTEFVQGAVPSVATSVPIVDGEGAIGTAGQYATATHVHPHDSTKQDLLVGTETTGQNIKTIEGNSILGTGNIDITAANVGLGNVTNESKATMFASPEFTGIPVAPTATAGTNSTQIATTAFVQDAITSSPQSMIFKGTIGAATAGTGTIDAIPTTDVVTGDTWMIVDEEKTLSASASATGNAILLEIGDLIIATEVSSAGILWIASPSKEDIGVTSVAAGTGLVTDQTQSTAITTTGTISLATSGVTAGTYGSSNKIPTVTIDSYGRVTSASENTISIPSYNSGPGISIANDTISETYTTCTLPTFSAAGFQNVTVPGITGDSHPVLDVYITNASDVAACNEAWSHIYRADSYGPDSEGNGGITFYSDAATSSALTIMIKGY